MNILIAALELAPFAQYSPAAESVASLAKALRLLGHDLTIAVPKLPAYEEAGLMAARQLSTLDAGEGRAAVLYDTQLPSGVKLLLVDVEAARFDPAVAPDAQAGPLGALSCAVAAIWKKQAESGAPFDVIHAHDAGAGLAFLRLSEGGAAGLAKVLTVHDAARAGEFSLDARADLGIPEDRAGPQGFASGDGLCLLKGLVVEADAIVTPSDSYGRKLKAPEKYGALSRAFHGTELLGIVEGVDHAVFNPATDAALVSRYDAPNPSNKGRNKMHVLSSLGLDFDINRPVIFAEDVASGESAMATLVAALPSLIRADVTLIIAGSKEGKAENAELLSPFEKQVKWVDSLSASTRRKILAAADFYLSMQRRDPSGQRIMQAFRYGAIPIAFQTDAVPDVVVDADAELRTGTGILYDSMTQRAVAGAVARAVSAYRNPAFTKLLSRVMRQDLGWDRSARRHVQVYRNAVAARL